MVHYKQDQRDFESPELEDVMTQGCVRATGGERANPGSVFFFFVFFFFSLQKSGLSY